MITIDDKYHRNKKIYTVTEVDLENQVIKIVDSCGTTSSVPLLRFAMSYSKLPKEGIQLVKS